MHTKHVLVTLDGVDGVGKTTVATLLAADGSFHYYKSPSGPFALLRGEIDAHATPVERYCFYRLATQFDAAKIAVLLEYGSVVCDRYIASAAAYHIAMDARVRAIHSEAGLLKPHFSFLLGARADKRDRRIADRPPNGYDARLEQDSTLLDRVADVFLSFDLRYIDTSDLTVQEVARTIKCAVQAGA